MADSESDDNSDLVERVENQPYDELVEVPDGEEVASVYTPTPRNQKLLLKQQQPQQQPQSNQYSYNNINKLRNQSAKPDSPDNTLSKTMSESNSQSSQPNTPKPLQLRDRREPKALTLAEKIMQNKGSSVINPRVNAPKKSNAKKAMGELPKRGEMRMQAKVIEQQERHQETGGESDTDGGGGGGGGAGAGDNDSAEGSQQEPLNELQGGYDPAAFRDLAVPPEIKDIFKFIERYQPQTIELEYKLKPFIPEYIPCIGDIDAFLKIPRPDGKPESLGLNVVDEPSSRQTDPHVLDLQLRTLSKQSTTSKPSAVKMVDKELPKAIDSWIKNINQLQKNKPVQIVNYAKPMPDVETLMQVWPQEYEELLKEIQAPTADLNVDTQTFADLSCGLMDIPVYKSRVQSLHVLFTLYSEFKNSEHFKNISDKNQATTMGNRKNNADQLVIE